MKIEWLENGGWKKILRIANDMKNNEKLI